MGAALLAFLHGEPGADAVEEILAASDAVVRAVNWCEVLTKLASLGRPQPEVYERSGGALCNPGAGDRPLRPRAGAQGGGNPSGNPGVCLSLADRACLALGTALPAPVVTADRSWRATGLKDPVMMLLR